MALCLCCMISRRWLVWASCMILTGQNRMRDATSLSLVSSSARGSLLDYDPFISVCGTNPRQDPLSNSLASYASPRFLQAYWTPWNAGCYSTFCFLTTDADIGPDAQRMELDIDKISAPPAKKPLTDSGRLQTATQRRKIVHARRRLRPCYFLLNTAHFFVLKVKHWSTQFQFISP